MSAALFDTPGIYGVAPGGDFPAALVAGLSERFADQPPEALARVTLYVNTARMARRIEALFAEGPARLLPRIRLITDLGRQAAAGLPPSVPALRRRLELRQLVARLIATEPDLAADASAFDLANSLAALMDEMQGEGVTLDDLRRIDVGEMSGHWARSLKFLDLVGTYLGTDPAAPMDPEARQRRVVEQTLRDWAQTPPRDPVIVAGSTASRGTTAMFMEAVARLPRGAVVLPGLDRAMPQAVWQGLTGDPPQHDHPQYRLAAFAARLGVDPWAIPNWHAAASPPATERNALVSLALRPAPVTDAWRRDGPALGDLRKATRGLSLIEAADPREEALAIALRLRGAVEDGQTAALITPDRMLTRRVTAALARWGIVPDDSAGEPLRQSAPGRLVRHVAGLFGRRLTAADLLVILKHPLVHCGAGRNQHLLWTRELERTLRRHGPPFPDAASLAAWARAEAARRPTAPDPAPWAEWVAQCCLGHAEIDTEPLSALTDRLLSTLELLAIGSQADHTALTLWQKDDGSAAHAALQELATEADHGGSFDPPGFAALLHSVLGAEVREARTPDPRVMIWGPLEARVQGVDLAILAGLNDGTWPELPEPDPWLNRAMRARAGLLMPERRIGLSAHDFQQAAGAPEGVLSRAARDADAQTIPSRWLNRLTNLLAGLTDQGGAAALDAMRGRGRRWIDRARALDRPAAPVPAAPRPAPQPPVAHRPRELAVTRITTLVRDPYEIYASKILRLDALDPLRPVPDARDRGTALHAVMAAAIPDLMDQPADRRAAHLLEIARDVLARHVPWPTQRRLWLGRLAAIAPRLVAAEAARQADARPVARECRGALDLPDRAFRLTAKADRLDRTEAGPLRLYDYKTGNPPSRRAQKTFDKQLLLEAVIAEHAGFEGIPPARVDRAVYLGLNRALAEVPAPLDEAPVAKVLAELGKLVDVYDDPATGYTAATAPESARFEGDYTHLSRAGEWEPSDPAVPERVGW